MTVWAKLFESAGTQVLVCKNESKAGEPQIRVEFPMQEKIISVYMGFGTKVERDAEFDAFYQPKLADFFRKFWESLGS